MRVSDTRVPRPGALTISSVAPIAAARSCMLRIPVPRATVCMSKPAPSSMISSTMLRLVSPGAKLRVPLVAAGGPKAGTLESALGMIAEVVQSGARGASAC